MTRNLARIVCGLTILGVFETAGRADEPTSKGIAAHASLSALRADYAERLRELDRRRIRDLAALASAKTGDESDQAYEELFSVAIARDLYVDAEAAALRRLTDASAPMPSKALALLVSVIAKADQGKYEESLASLAGFLKANAEQAADPDRPKLEESTAIALGEAYLQRLFAARKYEIATRLGGLIREGVPRPAIREHFAARMARLDLLGKPSPSLAGIDADGKPVKLADFQGKVVLVDFWATWCPPCAQAMPELAALSAKYGKHGFVILGVNLDAQRQDFGTVEKARPIVRRYLVAAGAGWPNILAAPGGDDPTKSYGVTDIPANFLIGRDGKIVGFELYGKTLNEAVAEEVDKK